MTQAAAEKEYQGTVVQMLGMLGYVGVHVYPLQDRHGVWRTPTTSPGWPDLVFLRAPRVLAIEVKVDKVKVPEHQVAWLSTWAAVPCARAWVVRPSDPPWDALVEWCRRPAQAPQVHGFEPMDAGAAAEFIRRYKKEKRSSGGSTGGRRGRRR